jgi:phosphoribosylformylglycinamidine synthase
MTEKESALYSHYIIDGMRLDMTPAELLDECMDEEGFNPGTGFGDIIDESTEPPLSAFVYDNSKEQEYLAKTTAAAHEERPFRMLYPEHFTRLQIAKALLGRLWSKGHFKLGNLKLWAQWEWDPSPVGNMSAFYRSVESASEYIYGLGVNLEDYLFIEGDEGCNAKFYAWLDNEYDTTLFKSSPFESSHPWIGEERACSSTINPDPESWIIYIPFDTCGYRLGASLLTEVAEHNGGKAPDIADPDYFIDCYEVVRELVEDGFVISGRTVADGGLITAAKNMCGQYGIDMDIKGIMSSYQEERFRVLFGEIPGVIIQVSDENYDYIDSQLLLQDIAYYPIGHPRENDSDLNISETGKNGVADILISLLGHASEGED